MELIQTNWTLFQADGGWHHIGHGIEVMATPDMWVGNFWIRAQEPPVPGKTAQGEQSLAQNVHPAEQIHTQPDEAGDDQPMS